MYSPIFYETPYAPTQERYTNMVFRKAGKSGLSLPAVSLGLYHFFGNLDPYEQMRKTVRAAFEHGIFHLDVADCYGPPNGEAEYNLGRIIRQDFLPYRDELVIATKAGFDSFLGPNGEGGSRKHLTAAMDRSLKNLGLEYVDVFYHHVEDPSTPLEETAEALAGLVRQGKALYIGISNYSYDSTKRILELLRQQNCPVILNQCRYNMLHSEIEQDTIPLMAEYGVGIAAYVPLAQGLLSQKYINQDYDLASRKDSIDFEQSQHLSEDARKQLRALNEIAYSRGQTLAQMAMAWCLRSEAVTTVLIGCRNERHFPENLTALQNLSFSEEELSAIREHAEALRATSGNG